MTKLKLDRQALLDEEQQAYKRYGVDQHQIVAVYLEGLIDGASCYELSRNEAIELEKLIKEE